MDVYFIVDNADNSTTLMHIGELPLMKDKPLLEFLRKCKRKDLPEACFFQSSTPIKAADFKDLQKQLKDIEVIHLTDLTDIRNIRGTKPKLVVVDWSRWEPDPEAEQARLKAEKATKKKIQAATKPFRAGEAALRNGKVDESIKRFTKAIDSNPSFAEAFKNRGDAKFAKRDFAGAISDYDQAIRINPEFIAAYQQRFEAKREIDDLEGAISDRDMAKRLQKPKLDKRTLGIVSAPNVAAHIRSLCQTAWVELEAHNRNPPATFRVRFDFSTSKSENANAALAWLQERKKIYTGKITKENTPGNPTWRVTASATTTVRSLAQLVEFVSRISDAADENDCSDMTCGITLISATTSGEGSIGQI